MSRLISAVRARIPINHNYTNALLTGYGLMGVTIVVQLMLVPLYLEHLGKEKFGILAMIMAANSYAAIGAGWFSGGIARILAERAAINDMQGFKAGYAFAKWLYVGYAVIAAVLFWSVAPWLLKNTFEEKDVVLALVLATLYLVLLYEYNADRAAFNALHWQAKGNSREIIGQLVFALGVVIGLQSNWGLPSIIGAQIAGIITTRTLAWLFWKKNSRNLCWSCDITEIVRLWKRVSGKMGQSYASYGALVVTLQANTLILGFLSGPEVIADYYMVWRIPEVIILLLWRAPGTLSPFLIAMDVKNETNALAQNYKRGLFVMIALAALSAATYAVIGKYIVSMWVGDAAPQESLPYFLAAGAMFFLVISKWPAGFAYALVNTLPLIKIALLELLLKLIVIYFLVDTLGYTVTIAADAIIHSTIILYLYLRLGQRTIDMRINKYK